MGFVRVIDDKTIIIPDRPGNNRADTMQNIIANPNVGILFLIPGIEDTLRLNGKAEIIDDPDALAPAAVNGKPPKLGIRVKVDEVFFHCAKAFRRSKLWDPVVATGSRHPAEPCPHRDGTGPRLRGRGRRSRESRRGNPGSLPDQSVLGPIALYLLFILPPWPLSEAPFRLVVARPVFVVIVLVVAPVIALIGPPCALPAQFLD